VETGLALARRLERAEANANARFVEARARIQPDSGACWIEVAGAYAMYDGPRSPCTQTFGLGLDRNPTPEELDRIEQFFRERGAPVMHEVSPMADPAMIALLSGRGYQPIEFTSVMFLPLADRIRDAGAGVAVRVVDKHESAVWARTAVEGWRDQVSFADLLSDLMQIVAAREQAADFLAEIGGQPVAAGALAIHERVALLAGASTIPEWRRRGAQRALMEARLDYAERAGCDLAMISAGPPGGASERNAARQGFRTAYTRVKWELIR
jgi:GNAT superfamily N-acetyltransferase